MIKGHTIKVLDHGYVRFVDVMGTDERIVEAARISYQAASKGKESDQKLIEYLYKNKHTSPFEQCKIVVNIKLPIFVMRDYVRHRMQNLNEVSARYTVLPNEFYIPDVWRQQDLKNKQCSQVVKGWDPKITNTGMTEIVRRHCEEAYALYEEMMEKGVAREMARMVLPVNIYTEIYACWDLKNLLHFIGLRDHPHAQFEIQEFARAIKSIAEELFPMTMAAYDKYKWILTDTTEA